jgi:hypothetical protein
LDFGGGEDDREMFRLPGSHGIDRGFWEGFLQDVAIEKLQGTKGLVLSGGGNVAFNSQMGQECLHFSLSHVLGVVLPMKQDVTPNPFKIGYLGTIGIMLNAKSIAYLVK